MSQLVNGHLKTGSGGITEESGGFCRLEGRAFMIKWSRAEKEEAEEG